ncbi:MAG: DNA methyltransferase [Bacteroidia bacterium]|nr:site-specific DNA-methyltransferase [Bacteroidia bacterium]MDW8133827.1 DNA methyltransferase [Bacteroidia bacterium]
MRYLNENLLERVITASSNPGDLMADFFYGFSTTFNILCTLTT